MGDVDLLDGFTFGPSTVQAVENNDYFTQHFWGEKNHGFDVLYHNMKHGQISVKSLQDFIRESANSEDLYAKHLTKLAKQAANSSPLGSFAPMFEVFKVMAEKLSSCHMDVVHKLQDIIKDLSKYLEEQKSKHKQVKDELSGTADALHQIQAVSASVQKSKEKYHQLCLEAERLKRAGGLSKDVEKVEVKSKKASEEYKNLVDKYKNVRSDFEQKMTDSAKRFQEIEVAHLKHMKSVLDSYILSFENANVLVSQVHQEFRRQVDENSIESLIKQYSENKGTGTEKPEPITFEECDVNSMLTSIDPARTNGVANEEPTTNKSRINLPFRRKKPRKSPRENTSGNKDTDKETESMESPDKDLSVKIDDEGYTIRPETPKETKNTWSFGSSDSSDSDSDDYISRKIHVKINPKDKVPNESGENNLLALNEITRNLTLNSPTPTGGKKLTRRRSDRVIRRNSPMCTESQTDSHDSSRDTSDALNSPVSPLRVQDELSSKTKETASVSPKLSSLSGAVKVLPSAGSSNEPSKPVEPPVPAPRRISMRTDISKLSMRRKDKSERFSTTFVPYNESTGSFDQDSKTEFNNPGFEASEDRKTSMSSRTFTENSSSADGSQTESNFDSPTTSYPLRIPPRLTRPQRGPSNYVEARTSDSSLSRISEQSSDAGISPSHSSERNVIASGNVPSDLVLTPKPPQPRNRKKTIDGNVNKPIETPSEKSEKSVSDELLDLFGNSSVSSNNASKPPAPAATSNNIDVLADLFGNNPASLPKSDPPPKIPQSSSNVSLNNLFVMPDNDKEVNAKVRSNDSPARASINSLEFNSSAATSRPDNLTLTNAWPEPLKASALSSKSAPLASSESWSSLSSIGGTPMDSFASSRGPSPLTLMQGDPIPIAVAFTETVNAYFKGPDEDKCMVKITGEVQISFPAGIIKAFTSNPNPPVLSFKVKATNVQTFTPKKDLLFSDSSLADSSERLFWMEMPSLTSYLKKLTESNPNSPYYNVQVLSYQFASQSGRGTVPLHLSSVWKCDVDSTEISVDYKYNSSCNSHNLKNVQVLVPVNGGVTNAQSLPNATWLTSQNRLVWNLGSSVSINQPSGTLKSKLSLSSGPSKPSPLAVQFMSEGSTLTGVDFELAGSGYRLSLVKKRFVSGKYLSDGN